MISIYSKKKTIIDLILNIYLLIISCLGIFVKRSSILAFSGGLYIGGGDIGISVTDIINYCWRPDSSNYYLYITYITLYSDYFKYNSLL